MNPTPTLFDHYKARRAAGLAPAPALSLARQSLANGRAPWPGRRAPTLTHGDCVRFRDASGARQTAVVAIVPDSDMGAPWEEHDGHGPVSDWTTRAKRPGELVLNRDHGARRYYDFAEAVKIARRDGWNDFPAPEGETAGQRAARAARADFERLRGWCNDQWEWVGVCLFLLPRDGVERSPSHIADAAPFGVLAHAALWGIESDSPDYLATVAHELTSELR